MRKSQVSGTGRVEGEEGAEPEEGPVGPRSVKETPEVGRWPQ